MKKITPRPVVIAGNSDSATQTEGSLSIRRIRLILSVLKQEQELTEIRILNTENETIYGRFDDQEQLVKRAIIYDGKRDILVNLNLVKSELKERSTDQLNQLTTNVEQTISDDDVENMQWFVIAIEPKRPSGVSSTDREKAEAMKLAKEIGAYLEEQGLPKPFEADSGNGSHLILKVNIDATPDNVKILEKCLEALHFRFSTNTVEVKLTTSNPSGFTVLYGTMVCEGENTEDRPHRRSGITNIPKNPTLASLEKIKKVADTLSEVSQEIPKSSEEDGSEARKRKQSDLLLKLISDCEFFHSNEDEEYATVVVAGKRIVFRIKSKNFRKFVLQRYFASRKTAPQNDSITQAIDIAMMKATCEGQKREIFKRVGVSENGVYFYDLNNDGGQVVQITRDRCTIISDPPIIFFQSKNMGAQVLPDFDTKPESLIPLLKKHFCYQNETDLRLFACYLVTCLVLDIPHPILILFGEKGASKSTSMRMTKRIIDPARQEILAMPTSKDDLAISLCNHLMPCYDNLQSISAEKSNLLCMAATGGAFSKRTLYTDDDETILEIKRCVVLNGINIMATQSDLLDRVITLELSRISEENRLPEELIWRKFEVDLPKILGAIFNTLKGAISIRPSVELEKVGRMADFTYWGYAIAEVLGVSGQAFLEDYLTNQRRANEEALASNPVATAVIALMRERYQWVSSVTRLLKELEGVAMSEQINTHTKIWPADASVLTKRMNEVKSNLQEIGIFFNSRPGGDYKKIEIVNDKNKENGLVTKIVEEKKQKGKYSELIESEILNFDDDNEQIG